MNEQTTFCQSCGMPLETTELLGTNKDGTKNESFCSYCYKDGAYTFDCTMDQMIEACVPPMVEANAGMTKEQARGMMKEFFPTLARWK